MMGWVTFLNVLFQSITDWYFFAMGVGIAFPAPFKIVSCGLINSEAKVVLVLLLRLCVHVI